MIIVQSQKLHPQHSVTRSFKMGVRFQGESLQEKRALEREANQRVKGLQIQQESMIYNNTAREAALNIARNSTRSSKFASQKIAKITKNGSNLGKSAYFLLHAASKAVIEKEKKAIYLIELLQEWNIQACEWIVFGRSPYVEKTLMYRLGNKRIYIINLVSSLRRNIDKYLPTSLKLNKSLPKLSNKEMKDAIQRCYEEIRLDFSKKSNPISEEQEKIPFKIKVDIR